MGRTVQDACIMTQTMAGYDPMDSTSLNKEVPDWISLPANVKGKKIGVVSQEFDGMCEEYKAHYNNLIENLKKEGAIIKEINMPSFEMALKLYYIIAPAEAASNLSRYDGLRYGNRREGDDWLTILQNSRDMFGDEVKRRILIGNFVLYSDEYDSFFGKALKLRAQIRKVMHDLFQEIDVVMLPTTASVAFPIGKAVSAVDMYKEDLYTIIGNMYGGPAISLPLCKLKGFEEKDGKVCSEEFDCLKSQDALPIGIQLMANVEDESNLLQIAKKIEAIVEWKGWENV